MKSHTLIAVDVGNNRLKFGRFEPASGAGLPEPVDALSLEDEDPQLDRINDWLADRVSEALCWWVGSVNRPTTTRLVDWLQRQRPGDEVVLLAAGDLPITVGLERPDMVGIDRLLDAVAANHLRRSTHPAVVVDLGSAITVDLVSAEGAFLGGSILPGIAMSARGLHEFTDLLPLVEMSELADPPTPLGDSTTAAMRSGLYWGAVGAIRELIARLTVDQPEGADVFLTGGAGSAVAGLLGRATRHIAHLTLAGIALTAGRYSGGR
jgi:type III pantothenate kinase